MNRHHMWATIRDTTVENNPVKMNPKESSSKAVLEEKLKGAQCFELVKSSVHSM